MISRFKFFVFFVFFSSLHLSGQDNYEIEANISIGHIIKHRKSIRFDNSNLMKGVEFTFIKSIDKEWYNLYTNPKFGIAFSTYFLGDKHVLGYAYGVSPFISFGLISGERFNLDFRPSMGIAYLTKKYNRINNPDQNTIGSNINSLMSFTFVGSFNAKEKLSINSIFRLWHYSNGAFKLPNLGINSFVLSTGVNYKFGESGNKKSFNNSDRKYEKNKIDIGFNIGGGFRETGAIGGPNFPMYFGSLEVGYGKSKIHHLKMGYEYEMDMALYYFVRHPSQFLTIAQARKSASRHMMFLADEILFGNFGMWIQGGVEILNDFNNGNSAISYFRYGWRYHYFFDNDHRKDIHFGVYVKSHFAIAQYFCFALGTTI